MELLEIHGCCIETELSGQTVVVAVTREELVFIANSIGEALEAVDEWEFHSLLGALPSEARDVREQIKVTLRRTFIPE